MRIRSGLPAIAIVAALVLSSCGGSSDSGSDGAAADKTTTSADAAETTEVEVPDDAEETDQVGIENLTFSPKVITVKAGTIVTFTNDDTTAHTVTSDDGTFDTGTIAAGDSLTLPFDEPGTFAYHCEIHPSMTGTVIVTA